MVRERDHYESLAICRSLEHARAVFKVAIAAPPLRRQSLAILLPPAGSGWSPASGRSQEQTANVGLSRVHGVLVIRTGVSFL